MKFNIPEQRKKEIIQANLEAVEAQLYGELMYLAIDPEAFEFSFMDDKESPEDRIKYYNLKSIVEKIVYLRNIEI
jgi:hypothetical protein